MTQINNNTKYRQQQQQSQIPRPLNCFLMYRLEKQKEIIAKCPTANHRDISKIIAKWWQEASDEEKEPFRERARIAKKEHNALYPNYKYAPKKKVTPKRVYIRRNNKQQFTSRAKENNMLMEMIYDNPTALKNPSLFNTKTNKKNTIKASQCTIAHEPLSPVLNYSTVSVNTEGGDVCYRASCSASPQMSFASYSSSATTPFDSPHMSPYSDYSEFEISNSVSSCETAGDYTTLSTITTPLSCDALSYSNSPFSVLDSPFISESNAYATDMNYNTGMVDYFHFDHSNTNNTTFKPTTTQEFSWTEPCEALTFKEQYQLLEMVQQVSEPLVQYINPALLQLN